MAARKKTAPTDKASRPNLGAAEFEPSVRRFVDWTTDLIKQAEISADSGYLRSASRVCEWILTDDRVSAALNIRVQALLGLDPTFEASGDKRRSGRAVKALDAGEDWWDSYPEPESALVLKWGLVLGVGPAQHTWSQSESRGTHWLPGPEFWHPYNVRFDIDRRAWKTWVSSAVMSSPAREIEFEPGDSQWILHCPFGKNRPWAWGLWHGLAPLVLLKSLAKQDWSRASEKSAILKLTMEMDAAKDYQSQSRQQRQQLAADIYNRGRNAVTALPPGIDLDLVQTVADTEELFKAQIDMANTAIAIMIRGGNLGTENDGGSRAATESQARSGDLVNLRFDAQSWTTTVHDQSLVWWAKFNYGDPGLAPWPVYPVEPEEDLGAKTEADKKALENVDKAEGLGFDVDRQAFLDQHKISWCKPGERPPEPKPPEPATVPNDPSNAEPGGNGEVAPSSGEVPVGNSPGSAPAAARGIRSGVGQPGDRNGGVSGHATEVHSHGARLLASGAKSRENAGFISGQLYADALTDAGTEFSQELLAPTFDAIREALETATDYDSLRENLRSKYADLDHETMMELVEHHLVIAHLAGRAAVNEDA